VLMGGGERPRVVEKKKGTGENSDFINKKVVHESPVRNELPQVIRKKAEKESNVSLSKKKSVSCGAEANERKTVIGFCKGGSESGKSRNESGRIIIICIPPSAIADEPQRGKNLRASRLGKGGSRMEGQSQDLW